MTTDEQIIVIGKLTMERAAANRQHALLNSEIGRFQTRLYDISKLLAYTDDPERMTETSSLLDSVVSDGGLDRLKTLLAEHQSTLRRASEITKTLKDAGAE
jgi:hypothetical protein